jgi:hypothetical protein
MSCDTKEFDEDLLQTWIAEIDGGALALRRADMRRLSARLQERERTLFSAIVSATTRFVMVVDESLHLRRTLAYSPGDQLPSPIELAMMAARLRRAKVELGAAQGASLLELIAARRRHRATGSRTDQ